MRTLAFVSRTGNFIHKVRSHIIGVTDIKPSKECGMKPGPVEQSWIHAIHRNGLVSHHQHGFILGHSCATQLLETLETCTKHIDEGYSTNCTYLHFAKALDKEPPQRLPQKLSAHGIKVRLTALENISHPVEILPH